MLRSPSPTTSELAGLQSRRTQQAHHLRLFARDLFARRQLCDQAARRGIQLRQRRTENSIRENPCYDGIRFQLGHCRSRGLYIHGNVPYHSSCLKKASLRHILRQRLYGTTGEAWHTWLIARCNNVWLTWNVRGS